MRGSNSGTLFPLQVHYKPKCEEYEGDETS